MNEPNQVLKAIGVTSLVLTLVLFLLIGGCIGHLAWQARHPADMPSNSVWIDAPAVPFGFYRGWWLGCWIDSDGKSDKCELWGSGGLKTVYEGICISCDTKLPVPVQELHLRAPDESANMWVGDSEGTIFAPAAFLTNGKILVPIQIPASCQKFQQQQKQ